MFVKILKAHWSEFQQEEISLVWQIRPQKVISLRNKKTHSGFQRREIADEF